MGTGKTTIGKLLASKLNKSFLEQDELIVERQKMSIPEIFAQLGEIRFREIEMQLCKELSQRQNCVISTGGGVVLNKLNIDYYKQNGIIVLLEATAREIFNRISLDGKEKRPLLNKPDPMKEIQELLIYRKPFYDSAADIKISTYKKMPEQIADEIIDALRNVENNNSSQSASSANKSLGTLFNELSKLLIIDEQLDKCDDLNKKKTILETSDAELLIVQECTQFSSIDPLKLLDEILTKASNNNIELKSWHYCGIIPGIILSTIRNYQKQKGTIKWVSFSNQNQKIMKDIELIDSIKITIGIKRGMLIPYGAESYLGISEFAIGSGIAISVLLGSTPKSFEELEFSNKATHVALTDLINKRLLLQEDKKSKLESVIISSLKYLESNFQMKFFT